MQVDTLVKLIHLMSPHNSATNAISTKKLAIAWEDGNSSSEPEDATLRQIQRYVYELSMPINHLPPLLDFVEEDQTLSVQLSKSADGPKSPRKPRKKRRYYLHQDTLMKWFMSEQAALNLLLTGQVVGQALGDVSELGTKSVAKLAKDVIKGQRSPKLSRIASSVRFLSDGIGRLPAQLAPDLLQTMIDAIVRDRGVSFDYKKSDGKCSHPTVNPLGLVSKDGTIYLIASKGSSSVVVHYALQRASNASVEMRHFRMVPEAFDLDQHIESTHRLSHQIGPEMTLVLEVDEKALFHFTERPLTTQQEIKKIRGTNGYRVSAVVPDTFYLRPFLLSMRANVTVVEPVELRKSMAVELKQMVANYTSKKNS
jgi:predicted DNA-binding transcriptional regulator YafY